jgi:hypothetical protein
MPTFSAHRLNSEPERERKLKKLFKVIAMNILEVERMDINATRSIVHLHNHKEKIIIVWHWCGIREQLERFADAACMMVAPWDVVIHISQSEWDKDWATYVPPTEFAEA